MSLGELASAKAGAFHFFEKSGHGTIAVHLDWTCRSGQVLRCFWFSLSNHAGCEPRVFVIADWPIGPLSIANCRLPIGPLSIANCRLPIEKS
jgi:hypothetical protein